MAKKNINIGVNPNDGTGDVVREAFRKAKENFDELYARPTGDMNKSTYDSDNSGAVDQADKITGVDAAGNVTYYGKDAAGNIGFHSFSEDKVAVYDAGVAGFEGVLYIDIANFKLYLWDDVNEVYINASGGIDEAALENILVNTTRSYNNAQNAALSTLTDATTLTWDLLTQQGAYLLATSGVGDTRTLPNSTLFGIPAGSYAEILFKQDATGGRKIAFDTNFGDVIGTFDERPNEYTLILVKVVATDKARVVLSEWSGAGANSYNNAFSREFKGITDTNYTLVAGDENKFLLFTTDAATTITVPDNLFSDYVTILGATAGTTTFSGGAGNMVVLPPNGSLAKVKKTGFFRLKVNQTGTSGYLSGDLVKTFDVFQSPNGTLYKAAITDSGQWDITVL
jgi:hypothetical protein